MCIKSTPNFYQKDANFYTFVLMFVPLIYCFKNYDENFVSNIFFSELLQKIGVIKVSLNAQMYGWPYTHLKLLKELMSLIRHCLKKLSIFLTNNKA